MKVAVISIDEIQGKDGRSWARIHGFTKKGKAIKAFTEAKNVELPESALPDKAQVQTAFGSLPTIEVDFNEDGRVEGVSLPDEE